MERLLDLAAKSSYRAEVFSVSEQMDEVHFENSGLKEISSSNQKGYSLRIIKDGKIGAAYTKNLDNREEFLQNAIHSLKGDVKADFEFPDSGKIDFEESYNEDIEEVTNTDIVEECQRIIDYISKNSSGQINVSSGKIIEKIRVINTSGSDLSSISSEYFSYPYILFPGSYSSISRLHIDKKFSTYSNENLDYISALYNGSQKKIKAEGGRMSVLFLPSTMYVLAWRLIRAANGKSLYEKVSPLENKIGTKIFDEKLSFYDDPECNIFPGARIFDDEGVKTQKYSIVKNGIFNNFYFDLNYASKMKVKPTGHGYKSAMWGGEKVSIRPAPSLSNLKMETGEKSLDELVKSMDKGIIVAGALGAHSGNILNGDFSIGLSPGLYVKDGKVVGSVSDGMVSGNVYDVMKNVSGVENRLSPGNSGKFPSVVFEDVSVAFRK